MTPDESGYFLIGMIPFIMVYACLCAGKAVKSLEVYFLQVKLQRLQQQNPRGSSAWV